MCDDPTCLACNGTQAEKDAHEEKLKATITKLALEMNEQLIRRTGELIGTEDIKTSMCVATEAAFKLFLAHFTMIPQPLQIQLLQEYVKLIAVAANGRAIMSIGVDGQTIRHDADMSQLDDSLRIKVPGTIH